MNPPPKDWVDILAALLTPTVAVAAVVIGVLQERTNQIRLKHELFDRRHIQFVAVRDFLGSIVGSGKVSEENWRAFLTGTRGSNFLFDDTISKHLEAINERAVDLMTLQDELSPLPVGEERSENVEKQRELRGPLYKDLMSLEKKFYRFLKLNH